jgi:hypothetical protein
MKKVIGTITTYVGTDRREHPYLAGYKVRITAVLRAGDPDDPNHYVTDDHDLARLGGLRREDRVDVQPWLAKEGRFSFVGSDPRVCDLEGFESLLG